MRYFRSWVQFITERFDPVSYFAMIFSFLGAHYVVYANLTKQKILFNFENILYAMPLALAVLLFFFKLRLFDEVKDIESDAIHHPERPLPRGILQKKDILRATFIIIAAEMLLFSFYGFWSLVSALIGIAYSLLMYKEFFVKKWLRSHLTTYAIMHTFVVFFISIAIFSALLDEPFIKISPNLLYFSLGNWFLFNIFEFGRKTFAQEEEKQGIDSYSKVFGRFGAVLLVFFMAISSLLSLYSGTKIAVIHYIFAFLLFTIVVGFLYAILNRPLFAKAYRLLTSLYIIVTYSTIIICGFFTQL